MIFKPHAQIVVEKRPSTSLLTDILSKSFLVAYLLTGSTIQAERAIQEAIDIWEPNEDDEEQIFQATLRIAAQKQAASSSTEFRERPEDFFLPVELRRVQELSPELRSCFVLRILIGLTSLTCAQILNLSTSEIDLFSLRAMNTLVAFTILSSTE